jgi:hypothetical protein
MAGPPQQSARPMFVPVDQTRARACISHHRSRGSERQTPIIRHESVNPAGIGNDCFIAAFLCKVRFSARGPSAWAHGAIF